MSLHSVCCALATPSFRGPVDSVSALATPSLMPLWQEVGKEAVHWPIKDGLARARHCRLGP